jgi:hypothetical protein
VTDLPADFELEPPSPRRYRTIDSFPESDIPAKFRFKTRTDLRRLLDVLGLPEVCTMSNRAQVSGEEVMLVGLRRMAYPSRFVDLLEEFGSEETLWCKAFGYFVMHIYNKFGGLVINGMRHWGD